MFEKQFEEKWKRAKEIEQSLADPLIIKDTTRYRQLAKELSTLQPSVSRYQAFKRTGKEIADLEHLLKQRGHDAEFFSLAQRELDELKKKQMTLQAQLEEFLIEDDPDAQKNIIVEIRAGTGGLEASLFAADLYRMYTRYAVRHHFKTELLSASPSEAGGFKEVICAIEGEGVYQRFKYERGVHRVQRVPVTEASGRIHTSAVTVAVLPQAKEVEVEIHPKDLRIDVFRSSGHGGQGVNTTDSAVRITHLPTQIVVSCQDERSQLKNKMKAMKVLRARLFDHLRQEQQAKISHHRRQQVGTGDRSEKIRTYNFPDRRVTDHRIGLTLHRLDQILEGDLEEIVKALTAAERKQRVQSSE